MLRKFLKPKPRLRGDSNLEIQKVGPNSGIQRCIRIGQTCDLRSSSHPNQGINLTNIGAKMNQAMFEESRMAKDIDEKLDYLSTTIHRLEIIDDIRANVHDARLDKLNSAALNLAASILECLILALEHFNKPPTRKCDALSITKNGICLLTSIGAQI